MSEETFFNKLEELENAGSVAEKIDLLVFFVTKPKFKEILDLCFNETVYGLGEQTIYNAFGIERLGEAHISNRLYEEQLIVGHEEYLNFGEFKQFLELCIIKSGNDLEEHLKKFLH